MCWSRRVVGGVERAGGGWGCDPDLRPRYARFADCPVFGHIAYNPPLKYFYSPAAAAPLFNTQPPKTLNRWSPGLFSDTLAFTGPTQPKF